MNTREDRTMCAVLVDLTLAAGVLIGAAATAVGAGWLFAVAAIIYAMASLARYAWRGR